jgi:outer membrane protein assembly factor BamB
MTRTRAATVVLFSFLIASGCGPHANEHPPSTPNSEPTHIEPPAVNSSAQNATPASRVNPGGTRKQGVDWPRFLGPTGDSVSPEKGIISPWPKEGLRVVWHKQLGMGYGMPTISEGRLFLSDRHGDKSRLTCMNSETGDELWRFEYAMEYEDYYGYNNGPRCSPVIDGDRVYTYGVEGMLHCRRVADGSAVWKVDTKADFGVIQNFFGVGSTPVIEGDLLIAQVGGSPKGSDETPFPLLKGNGSGVVAFDKLTGKVNWKATDELAGYAGPVLATINGRRLCFIFARSVLVALDPSTGNVDFHFPWRARSVESVNASNPVVIGDKVFLSETYGPGGALLKVKPGGYDVLWTDADKGREKRMMCHWNTPIYHDGYLYGCSGRHTQNAELRCIELATGRVMWSVPDLTRTSLLMIDGHFICLGEDGMLYLLKVNPQKYEEISRWEMQKPPLDYPCWAAPIVAHGLLYVRSKDRLVCLELIPAKK